MALVVKDRVKEITTTTGTGTYTLGGASTGFQSFSVIGNGNTTYYAVTDNINWEVGIGTYTASGTTLSRDTILASSNSNNAVNWSAGTKDIFVTYPAERSITGPSTATDNAVVRFDTTDGTIVQNSGVTIDDSNNMTGVVALTATGNISFDGGTFVFNDSGADKDFRVEGDTDTHLLFTDASTDRVGIGTNAPASKLEVTGDIQQTWATSMDRFVGSKFSTTYELGLHFIESSRETRVVSKAADSTGFVSFCTGVTPDERARITSGGIFLVGTNSAPSNTSAIAGAFAANTVQAVSATTPTNSAGHVTLGGGTGSPNAGRVFFGDNSGWEWEWGYVNSSNTYGRRFYFTDQGTAYNSSGTWGTISDVRLKENIVDATAKLAEVMMLRVRNFNFIDEPDKKHIGFVAQEIEQVFPKVVYDSKPDENGNTTKAVKTTVLIPILVKAIQELKTELDSVKAELAALKGA